MTPNGVVIPSLRSPAIKHSVSMIAWHLCTNE